MILTAGSGIGIYVQFADGEPASALHTKAHDRFFVSLYSSVSPVVSLLGERIAG